MQYVGQRARCVPAARVAVFRRIVECLAHRCDQRFAHLAEAIDLFLRRDEPKSLVDEVWTGYARRVWWKGRGKTRTQPGAKVVRRRPLKGPEQAETVAPGSHASPPASHGKEGVDGSSPSEGLKVLHTRLLLSLQARRRRAVRRGSARWRFAGTSRLRS